MTEKTDNVELLTRFQKHLVKAIDALDTANKEVSQVDLGGCLRVREHDHIQLPATKAWEKTINALDQAKEALAWCMVSIFETKQEIEKGE